MVALRPAVHSDIPALAELIIACDLTQRAWAGPEVPLPTLEEEALEWDLRFARAGSWIHVAEVEQRIAGVVAYAHGTVSRDDRTPVAGLAHVNALFVHPEHWRRGIARTLLDAAQDAMRAQGYDRAQLWTLEGSPAERFYVAHGWRRDGRRDHFPPMGLETVAYVKVL